MEPENSEQLEQASEVLEEASEIIGNAHERAAEIEDGARHTGEIIVANAAMTAQEIIHDAEMREVSAYHAEDRAIWQARQTELEAQIAALQASNSASETIAEAVAETILEEPENSASELTPPEVLEGETETTSLSTPNDTSALTELTQTEAIAVSANPGELPSVAVQTPRVRLPLRLV